MAALELRHWLTGRSSELLRSRRDPSVALKAFGLGWTPPQVHAWAHAAQAMAEWIAAQPTLSPRLLGLAPLEVGPDYVLRSFVSLGTATTDLGNYSGNYSGNHSGNRLGDGSGGGTGEIARAWRELREASARITPPAGAAVAQAFRRSVLEPCPTTFWDSEHGRFVIAEPTLRREDLSP